MFKKSKKLRSKKYAKKKKKFFWVKVSVLIVFLILAITGLSYFSKLQKLTISDIAVAGNSAISKEEILSLADKELEGNYFQFFSKKNIFLYPKKTLEEKIKETWKRLESVNIEASALNAIKISVTEKKPRFLWCKETSSGEMNVSDCYFLDESGYVFSKAPAFSDNVYFRFFGGINAPDPIGERYLSSDDFQKISNLLLELEKAGIKASKLLSKGEGEYELFLQNNSRVLMNDRQDFAKTTQNLKTLLESEAFKKDVKNSGKILDYIDLRYGNKIFYKFKP